MSKKLIDKDPFSNGNEYMIFEEYNCDICIKSSKPIDEGLRYTNADENNMPKCSIQRDIMLRMIGDTPIKEETVKICDNFIVHGVLCPYIKTEYPKHKAQEDKSQLKLFD